MCASLWSMKPENRPPYAREETWVMGAAGRKQIQPHACDAEFLNLKCIIRLSWDVKVLAPGEVGGEEEGISLIDLPAWPYGMVQGMCLGEGQSNKASSRFFLWCCSRKYAAFMEHMQSNAY